jgi:hypothetical protein
VFETNIWAVFDSLCIGVCISVCERQCLNNHLDYDVGKSLFKVSSVGDTTYSSLCS